ncbi:MAG: 2-hydroxyacyl-CoA dehydratase [Deltaproteobacteria bacterium]|jgi:benzoyl-CoA reductase/2-hydroxyglutaryl-CoA dehydratase subunit BcrC/BadD/HgdB|nr:2-hydroxyacyl-CoA dehydratase [Deltaproteobacteria bacterium]
MSQNPQETPVPAKTLLANLAANAYSDAWEAKKRGEKVGWCASNFPQELTTTLGVKVVYPENQAAAIAAKGGGLGHCEHAEGLGYSNDICAYARINLAFMDRQSCEEMNMPMPDFVLCCNNICNCMIKWYESISRELNIPFILLDVPYNSEFETDDDTLEYMWAQFQYAVKQLEEITGKKWSEKRFKEVRDISLRTSRAWLKAAGYCQCEPSPLNGFDLFNHMAVAVCARGTVEAAEAFEKLAEEYAQAAKEGASTYKGEQKFRILFEGIACWPYLRATSAPLKENGVNVTATVYATAFGFLYDDNPLSMMRAYTHVPNAISVERAARMRIDVGRRNKIDGAVIHNNRSCKLWSGIMPEIDRRIQAELKIPTVTFDGDQADPRNFSEEQYKTRIQALVEVMTENKKGKKQ